VGVGGDTVTGGSVWPSGRVIAAAAAREKGR
jgi:hypothetical protein